MLFGYRMQAIRIIATNVMLPRGLIGLGYDTLDYCGPELASLFHILSSSTTYPTLIHCTQGKDRTGIVVTLLLLLLDVPIDAITYDYRLSEDELLPMRSTMLKEITEIGLTGDFALCPEVWVTRMAEYLEERYGGVKTYLETIGVGREEQMRIVEMLQG